MPALADRSRQQPLRTPDVHADRRFIRALVGLGNERDVNKGGYCDARSGCVNFWCGPEDKPRLWTEEITQGDLEYPRTYVGGLYWNWSEDDTVTFYIDAQPFDLIDKGRHGRYKTIGDEVWEAVLEWLHDKAIGLINDTQRSLSNG